MEEQKNFKLVKLDIEKHQEMVEKMGIDSIPTIFLVFKGIIVDSIIGFPDEERLNDFFTTITSLLENENEENQIKSLLKEANEHIKLEEWELTEDKLNKALGYEKLRDKYGPIIKFGFGK
jgi:thioredoxin-like negative regulator of GroEL